VFADLNSAYRLKFLLKTIIVLLFIHECETQTTTMEVIRNNFHFFMDLDEDHDFTTTIGNWWMSIYSNMGHIGVDQIQ